MNGCSRSGWRQRSQAQSSCDSGVPWARPHARSRQDKDLTSRFPDVQAALQSQLHIDGVLDGEVVDWTGEKLDFGQLQLRLVTSPAKARKIVAERRPRSWCWTCCPSMASTCAASAGHPDAAAWICLPRTGHRRCKFLPVTEDAEAAREWLSAFSHTGVEGLVLKGGGSRYEPGKRAWIKVNSVGVGCIRMPQEPQFPLVRARLRSGCSCPTRVVDGCAQYL
ncbi:hypothetical protein [Kribbella sp. NPDC006257]|uniref:ATP-dependent DNA ligase n=1 Tax=Kribbella sp. NPDC006257 TaxID=3156738 RepID=UPI00339FBB9D